MANNMLSNKPLSNRSVYQGRSPSRVNTDDVPLYYDIPRNIKGNTASNSSGFYDTSIRNRTRSLVSQTLSGAVQSALAIDSTKGTFDTGSMNGLIGKLNFWYGRKSINAEDAKRLDNYFDVFGYAIGAIDTPNISARKHWNYIETAGLKINGNIPQEDMALIESIYDKGITFWKNPNEVGDYSKADDNLAGVR